MADHLSLTQDEFICPICLDVLMNPTTIPCGHSFCMDCITGCLNVEDQKGVYSCPQCRRSFTLRPLLSRNTMLTEVVERLNVKGLQLAPSAHCYAEPGDMECDVCSGRKLKAIKSCLVCLSSYCETHLRAHNNLNPGKKHKLIDATGSLQDLICPRHDKLLEVFCCTDQKCICLQCTMDEHNGHITVDIVTERSEKESELRRIQMNTQKIIQEREKDLNKLKDTVESLKKSAQTAIQDSEKIFSEMIQSLEKRCSEVTELIRCQERAEVRRTEKLMEELEQGINQLKRRDAEIQRLSQTDDHTHFLQSFHSLCSFSEYDNLPGPSHTVVSFEQLKRHVCKLKERLEIEMQHLVSQRDDVMKTEPTVKPKNREDFLAYSCQLTLDPNTAHTNLHLFNGSREVACRDSVCSYLDHPERFDHRQQVLCRERVSERCYWEVEWSGGDPWGVFIAVAYKAISRKENDSNSWFGYNDQSWCVQCTSSQFWYRHSGYKAMLKSPSGLTRVGVYVDHPAGILAFYTVEGNTMTLLHKVQATFTQPLYAGFWLNDGSTAKLCN